MNPDQIKIQKLEERLAHLEDIYSRTHFIDKDVFQNAVYLNGNVYFANKKTGFFGKAPVVQQAAISVPSGGVTVDSEARTAIGTIITTLQNLGLTL